MLRLVSTEPVHGALLGGRRRDWAGAPAFAFARAGSSGTGGSGAPEAVDAVRHLCAQLLALAAGGHTTDA